MVKVPSKQFLYGILHVAFRGTLHPGPEPSKGDFDHFVRCCFGPRISQFIGFSVPRVPFLGRS